MTDFVTVGDLKQFLERFQDDDKIVIAIRSYYAAHPVVYTTFGLMNIIDAVGEKEIRFHCSLGKGLSVKHIK